MTLIQFLLIALSVACGVLFSSTRSRFSKKHVTELSDLLIFNSLCAVVASVLLGLVTLITNNEINSFTLVFGLIYGVMITAGSLTALMAFKFGPLSYTTLITAFAMVIPSVAGVLFWNESIKPIKYLGMAMILVSVFFAVDRKKTDEKKTSLKWLFFCILTLFINGSYGVMQKRFYMRENGGGTYAFLMISFIVSAIATFIAYGILSRRKKQNPPEKRLGKSDLFKRVLIIFSLICGSTTVVNNIINTYLAGTMDSAVFFPVLNGCSLYTTIIVSVVIFKERLTKRQWFGLIVGFAAIMLLALS